MSMIREYRLYIITFDATCTSRKYMYPYFPPQKGLEFPVLFFFLGGGEFCKTQKFEEDL